MDDRDREACIAGIFLHLQYISYLVTSERLRPFPTKIGQRQRRTVAQPVAIFQTIAISSNDGGRSLVALTSNSLTDTRA